MCPLPFLFPEARNAPEPCLTPSSALGGLSPTESSVMAFGGLRASDPRPLLSLSGRDGRGRRESSPMRGAAPPQPWFGILCAGNEKPSVAMETAIPCSLCYSLCEAPVSGVEGGRVGVPPAQDVGTQQDRLGGRGAGEDGIQERGSGRPTPRRGLGASDLKAERRAAMSSGGFWGTVLATASYT